MLVVKVYMWPRGDSSRERLLTQATLDMQGVDEDGLRRYRVHLLKDRSFKGPGEDDNIHPGSIAKRHIWRRGAVRGHRPGRRGVWDLLGGALGVMLGSRLQTYAEDG